MTDIKSLHTTCKSCFFGIWKDNTQTGCSLGLIEKYKEQTDVIEVVDEVGDEFYVINDKHCQFKRSRVWGHRFGTNHDSAYNLARKENFPRVEMVVYLDSFDKTALKNLTKTLESIELDKIAGIRLINHTYGDPEPLSTFFRGEVLRLEMNHIPWYLINIIEDCDSGRACDIVIKQSKSQYFLVSKSGNKFPNRALEKLDAHLNEQFAPFSMVQLKDGSYISSILLYRILNGNVEKLFPEKVKEIVKEEGKEEMILHE